MPMPPKTYTLADLAERVGAQLIGDAEQRVHSVARLDRAEPDQLAFCTSDRYLDLLKDTRACAVLLREQHASHCPVSTLIVADPYFAYAELANLLHPRVQYARTVAESAVVDPTAQIGEDVYIGAAAVISAGAIIEPGCEVGPGAFVGRDAFVGAGSILAGQVYVGDQCHIGARAILHAGVVIGSDGFGFAPGKAGWKKVPQLGNVQVGDDVEIGANTTIDRGALEDTIIGDGVKLDNLVHIAHNVRIGPHTAIAGGTAIAGSTTIGARCVIAGQCAINGHIEICDEVTIMGMTGVANSIKEPGAYASGLPARAVQGWRRNVARVMKLDDLYARVRALEKQQRS
ncbi:MAG: UDP-3-O-(3-hydroxymyristoyl)glucosamine N-acyltransferase [Natronospirillum sp.]|uniref:UDP-3-O-(3-hydroxymyristoyl)glucosamine N-acyltransferase n=1 Tax=Natronospirillum sp. TaxID=2812955 RepID=UPI0025DE4283|nr:UDP-3-O-(3-hydroxymyristoyl)glucosamine N-acyltransferase [Natronospirillum sp.]MCH8551145.1 UDP-3-O-(3-hydroxymyristoyl)glucosamine N-acyltransferase [Natronospirillum sp.]